MRLLVSVRSPAEIPPALEGGAEIIDAKDPSRGALGPVGLPALREIARRLPAGVPLSVALGDPGSSAEVIEAIGHVDGAILRRTQLYVKLGLAGTPDHAAAEALASAAVRAASRSANRPAVIMVAYADHEAATAPDRWAISRMAARAGAGGVLIDTYDKDGRDLFAHVGEPDLRRWIGEGRGAGLLMAVAGSLGVEGVLRAATLGADIVGVRGAACEGGRNGVVVAGRVRALRSVVDRSVAVSSAPSSASFSAPFSAPPARRLTRNAAPAFAPPPPPRVQLSIP
ncbi:MAG: (5-formylfuran-3-yl)methyl phosphate synthase [Gemmatimonadota bacterium]|nr:(5-formylfuran-3-yl)methyl phosphate synthase [Gemmatimonadota bacterium]